MNKLKTILIAVAVLMLGMASACNKKDGAANDGIDPEKVVSLADIKDATLADSMAYYMGESVALSYWNYCKQDTTVAGKDNEKNYKDGFATGVKDMKDRRTYALAFASAMMAYEDVSNISKQLKINLNFDRIAQGFKDGMKDEKSVDPVKHSSTSAQLDARINSEMQAGQGKPLSASLVDSMSYHMGQSAAATYWEMCKQDSTIAGAQNAKHFLEGFDQGLVKAKDKRAYTMGYSGAVMACEQINQMNMQLNLGLSVNRMSQGFNYAMQSADVVDPVMLRSAMTQLETRLGNTVQTPQTSNETTAQQPQMQQDAQALSAAADKDGANQKTASGIRYKVVNAGSGSKPKQGDVVTVAIAFKDLNGNIIQTTKSEQSEYVSFVLSPNDVPYKAMVEMLQTMSPGSHAIFYVPASAGEGKVTDHILDVKLTKVSKQ